jgi:hypothetical protein
MRVEPPNIKVFVSSDSKGNPYEQNEVASLNTGLYCETVMNTRKPLLVPDALIDEVWKSNPDIKLGMISYLGMPIAWPDGEVFGTICVLDNKENAYSDQCARFDLHIGPIVPSGHPRTPEAPEWVSGSAPTRREGVAGLREVHPFFLQLDVLSAPNGSLP